MRVAVVLSLILLSACATEPLAVAPPPGVDLTGHWRLNVEESDDPQHLMQSPLVDPSRVTATQQPQSQGGRGGRGGRGGGGFGGGPGMAPPALPALSALNEALSWPGKNVDIKQVGGVVTMSSGGVDQIYRPTPGDKKPHHHKPRDEDGAEGRDRDMSARDRDGPPPISGWDDKTLVVQTRDAEDEQPPFEKRYDVSEDGQRLVEVVYFKGGRSNGFTASRTWDRVDPNSPASGTAPGSVPPANALPPGSSPALPPPVPGAISR